MYMQWWCNGYIPTDHGQAYIHTRMRRRTADFLQGNAVLLFHMHTMLIPFTVLRRARPDTEEKERKTASGRTFRAT